MPPRGQPDGSESKAGRFATTHWSLVCLAGRESDSPEVAAARDELCRKYWYPVYAHIRRLGRGPADAEDLTQEFFARMLSSRGFAGARREKGRFRSFTLGALKHFLADARDRATAQKRGGSEAILSWEQDLAEARIAQEPVDTDTPDRLFERRWALGLIEHALARLSSESAAMNRGAQYEDLKDHLTGRGCASSYGDSARKLGMSESAVKSAIHRLRGRYGQLLREEVAKTVSGPEEVDDEIRYLLGVIEATDRRA